LILPYIIDTPCLFRSILSLKLFDTGEQLQYNEFQYILVSQQIILSSMVTFMKKRIADREHCFKNIMAWAEITALCLELRKSVLKRKRGIDDDEELTRMVFSEIVLMKEKKWESVNH